MHVFYIIFIFFISGCGHLNSLFIDTFPSNNPLLHAINKTIDFENIKTGHIDEATVVILNEADSILKNILLINQNERTFSNTVLKLDDIYNTISNIWNIIELISSTHPNERLQLEADRNDLKISEYMIEISLHDNLYNAILRLLSGPIPQNPFQRDFGKS